MPKYIAKQSVGHFMPGDEVVGLSDDRIQELLEIDAIEDGKNPESPGVEVGSATKARADRKPAAENK